MQPLNVSGHRVLLVIVFFLIAAIGVISFFVPPAMGSDVSWGFQVLHNMERGGGFNLLVEPDPNNVALNSTKFLTWWSPGQYLIPYFFKILCGVNDGRAMSLAVTFCHLLGFAGFYMFFKKAGFSKQVAAISIALICCQQLFIVPYLEYNGGEVTIFGFIGWFLYGCMVTEKSAVLRVAFVLVSGIMGFVCKSSFIWMYFAGLCYMWIQASYAKPKDIVHWLKQGLIAGIPALLSVSGIWYFFLSRGDNPSMAAKGWIGILSAIKLSWMIFLVPASSPVLTGLSVDEYLHGLSSHPRMLSFAILIICTTISVYLLIRVIKTAGKPRYSLMLTTFYLVCIAFFASSYLRAAAISFEGRHVRLMGLMMLPGIVYLTMNTRSFIRYGLAVIAYSLILLNAYNLTSGFERNSKETTGNTGIKQPLLDRPTVNYLANLDKQSRGNIIVIPVHFYTCTQGLEVHKSRLINFEWGKTFKGHAGPLYVLFHADEKPINVENTLKAFPGYRDFSMQKISDEFLVYTAR